MLDRADVLAALRSGEFLGAVEADIAQARSMGVTSVPFFLFNGTHGLSGANPPDTFTSVLRTLEAGNAGKHVR